MNVEEAKSTIASYLSGGSFPYSALLEACDAIESDVKYVEYLRIELGLQGDWIFECDSFISRVAEFSELTGAEREREMPELAAHVEACRSCRRVYWSIVPTWISLAGSQGKAEPGKRLAEPIRLKASPYGLLSEMGLCLPSIERDRVAAAASYPELDEEESAGESGGAAPSARKEWSLEDADSGFELRLVIEGHGPGEMRLSCELASLEAPSRAFPEARIEIRETGSGTIFLNDLLASLREEPVSIPFGSWRVRLSLGDGGRALAWEIPLELEIDGARRD